MDLREVYELVRKKLLRHLKTEIALAAALRISRQVLNYHYVHAEHVCVVELFKMINLLYKLEKKETGYSGKNLLVAVVHRLLEPLEAPDVSPDPLSMPKVVLGSLSYFERVKLAVDFQKERGERRGRHSKNSKKCAEINRTCGLLKEYSDEEVVKKYALGSPDTFQRAKEILRSNRHELIEAVHAGLIKVNGAKKLLAVSAAQASALLGRKNTKEIRAFIARLPKL